MQVDPNNRPGPIVRTSATATGAPRVSQRRDETEFSHAASLERALEQTPTVRVGHVERARDLIGDVNYPPRETIRRISHLLALNLNEDSD